MLWERRAATPMVPLRLFRYRPFTIINISALIFAFGVFGSVFLLAQFFQVVQGYSLALPSPQPAAPAPLSEVAPPGQAVGSPTQ